MSTLTATVDTSTQADLSVHMDLHGYLKDASLWNREIAQLIAGGERVKQLTDSHLRVLEYSRAYFNRYASRPLPARIKKDIGLKTRHLFHTDPEVIFKIAGLPKPIHGKTWGSQSLYHFVNE